MSQCVVPRWIPHSRAFGCSLSSTTMIRAYTLVVLAVIATVGLAEASNAGRVCNITSYGASFGASGSVNSAALQSAFTACNNGGTVVIAAGVFVIDPMSECWWRALRCLCLFTLLAGFCRCVVHRD